MSGAAIPDPLLEWPAAAGRGASSDERRSAVLALAGPPEVLTSWPALVEHLLAVGRTDVALAKLVEGHVDALRIHHQAGTTPVAGAAYGVWASRSRRSGLAARRVGDGWVLDGTLAFASGAGVVDRALVPVWVDDETHVLLDLDVHAWDFDLSRWRTTAMTTASTGTAHLDGHHVDAAQVGPDDFYLGRPGFFPGGVGVAAVWAGGGARVVDLALAAVPAERRRPAQRARAGRLRHEQAAAVAICRDYARHEPEADPEPRTAATLVRAAVAAAARRVLNDAAALAGAVGLALDADLVAAVEDLRLYLAQQDADADEEWLGG